MKVVLDTNVVVSALIFQNGRLRWLTESWKKNEISPLVSRATMDELLRVLAYPKFQLTKDEIEALLEDYLPCSVVIEVSAQANNRLPICRDTHDQKFLALAAAGNAAFLITGDSALLELAGKTDFGVITPEDLRNRLLRN